MSVKQIVQGSEVTNPILTATSVVDKAVGDTMGPEGNFVAIEGSYGPPKITKDGVTVAEAIKLKDPVQNMIAQALVGTSKKVVEAVGDGTTTVVVLSAELIRNGLKRVSAGMSAKGISIGIRKASEALVDSLRELSKPCTDAMAIEQVATISANGDKAIGKMIASAVEKVGKDGVIMVQSGDGLEDMLDIQQGMQHSERGYLSGAFVTNPEDKTVEFDNPYILIADKKISGIPELLKVLEKTIGQQSRPLFIVAEDVESDALGLLVLNRVRGGAKVCAVKAPGFGANRKGMLEDLAILTNATVISEEMGLNLENTEIEHLGTAKRVIVTKDRFTVIEGGGDQSLIDARIAMLRQEAKDADSSYEKEKRQERLAKLSGGIAIIKSGGATEGEVGEKEDRFKDALNATRAAIEEGILAGGGVALLRVAADALSDLKGEDEDEEAGIAIVKDSVRAPLSRIIQNTGRESAVIVHEVMYGEQARANPNYGYNAAKGVYGDMIEMGIVDPTKVTRIALQTAASLAGVLLNVQCMIAEVPKEESSSNAGGMGSMGGMDMM